MTVNPTIARLIAAVSRQSRRRIPRPTAKAEHVFQVGRGLWTRRAPERKSPGAPRTSRPTFRPMLILPVAASTPWRASGSPVTTRQHNRAFLHGSEGMLPRQAGILFAIAHCPRLRPCEKIAFRKSMPKHRPTGIKSRPARPRATRLRRTAVVHTDHQNLEIWKSTLATEFRVAGAVHAFHHRHRFLTGLVWDMLAAAALLGKKDKPRSLLMLGLAGGTTLRILRHLLPACRFTAIDIDREIVRLARRHMALDATGVEVVVGDAYEWLRTNRRTFDVVIDDIYLAGRTDVFRSQTMSRPLLTNLRRAVAPGGVLAVNLVTGPGHRTMQSTTRRLFREAFVQVRSVTAPAAMNEVLVAGRTVATPPRLRQWQNFFPAASDRAHWRDIAVRRMA